MCFFLKRYLSIVHICNSDGDVVEAEAECKSGLTRPEAPLLETPVAFDQATPALSTPQESTPRRPKSVAKGKFKKHYLLQFKEIQKNHCKLTKFC